MSKKSKKRLDAEIKEKEEKRFDFCDKQLEDRTLLDGMSIEPDELPMLQISHFEDEIGNIAEYEFIDRLKGIKVTVEAIDGFDVFGQVFEGSVESLNVRVTIRKMVEAFDIHRLPRRR